MFSLILYQIKYILTFDDRNKFSGKMVYIYKNYQNSSKSFVDLEILQNAISDVRVDL